MSSFRSAIPSLPIVLVSAALLSVLGCSESSTVSADDAAAADASAEDGSDAALSDASLDARSDAMDAGLDGDLLDGADAFDEAEAIDAPLDVEDGDALQVDVADGADDGADDASESDDAWLEAETEVEAEAAAPPVETLVRVMAANLTSGNYQSYDPGEGTRIFQGLDPDVTLIQEFNYGANTPEALTQFVEQAFGVEFSYYRESGAQIPNGVISRWPIVEAGSWVDPEVSNRSFVWARIDSPAATDLWAVSVHLLTSNATERESEAAALLAQIDAVIPSGAAIVLGGDFNTVSRTENCFTVLSSRFVTMGPVDEDGNGYTNSNRTKPYDWVLASADLESLAVPLALGSKVFPDGLVFDSRVYTALDEVPPVLATDSAAPSMQHMGVMRTFLLP